MKKEGGNRCRQTRPCPGVFLLSRKNSFFGKQNPEIVSFSSAGGEGRILGVKVGKCKQAWKNSEKSPKICATAFRVHECIKNRFPYKFPIYNKTPNASLLPGSDLNTNGGADKKEEGKEGFCINIPGIYQPPWWRGVVRGRRKKVCAKSYPCKFKAALAPLKPKMRNKQQLPECKTRFPTLGSEKILHTNQELPNSNFLWSLSSQYSTLYLGRRSKKDTEARNVAHPDIEIQVSYRLLPFSLLFLRNLIYGISPSLFLLESKGDEVV